MLLFLKALLEYEALLKIGFQTKLKMIFFKSSEIKSKRSCQTSPSLVSSKVNYILQSLCSCAGTCTIFIN